MRLMLTMMMSFTGEVFLGNAASSRHVGEWNFQGQSEKRCFVGNKDMSEKCIFNTKT